jgi:hypothetical protein
MSLPEFAPDNKPVPDVATLTDNVTKVTHSFPFNINSLNWNYQMNTQSYDTIGGRVTQLLSTRINNMELQGDAGSRAKLMDLYDKFKMMQDNQNQNKVSMTLTVPSKNLKYNVWLYQMQMGWDVTTVTYPFVMMFQIDQDISGITSEAINAAALDSLYQGVGFNGEWTGLTHAGTNVNFSTLYQIIGQLKGGN